MLARDIYRDLYENSGPTLGEKVVLAGKRLGIVLACGALTLGVFDVAGVHSMPGVSAFIQSARMKIAGGIEPPHHQTPKGAPADAVRVAIPKMVSKPQPQQQTQAQTPVRPQIQTQSQPQPSVASAVDAIAAAGRKDAVTMAMTSASLTPPAFMAAKPAASGAAMSVPVSEAKPAPSASLAEIKSQTSTQPPVQSIMQISDLAARSQASVPPAGSIQLASLPSAASVASTSAPDSAAPSDGSIVASMQALIPLEKVPLPRMAPPLSPADRLGLKGKEYARAERCLANAIYFEARSEPIRGQMAVAQVVVNRAFSGFYPNDICGVVYQNASRHLSCQFTFACDGKSKAITERNHWAVANRIARQTLDGQIYVPEVAKSTHYHAAYVRPNWVREMRKLVRFGLHSFYRPYAWGNGNEEPVWGSTTDVARVHKTASR